MNREELKEYRKEKEGKPFDNSGCGCLVLVGEVLAAIGMFFALFG